MPGKVENTATVKVGNNPEVTTNTLKNPVPKKDWKEGSNGDNGNKVAVGSHVNYEIFYGNSSKKAETVTITDKLDANVKFVSATNGGTYDKATHTVTWTIPNVPTDAYNEKVSLEVQVLDGASAVGKIKNTATVQVGNGAKKNTNTLENPVNSDLIGEEHQKTIISHDGKNGDTLAVGDKVTYQIKYVNNESATADVTIQDVLDKGLTVDKASISNGGVFQADASGKTGGTITWTLKNVAASGKGTVTFTATVN